MLLAYYESQHPVWQLAAHICLRAVLILHVLAEIRLAPGTLTIDALTVAAPVLGGKLALKLASALAGL
jgi:hypothetical protein